MKTNIKKINKIGVLLIFVVLVISIFSVSNFIANAEPETLPETIKVLKPENELDQLLSDGEEIGTEEKTIIFNTDFTVDSWEYRKFSETEFIAVDTETNNFKLPGVYKSSNIALTEAGAAKFSLPTSGTHIEYRISVPLKKLTIADIIFNTHTNPLSSDHQFTIVNNSVEYAVKLGEHISYDGNWQYSLAGDTFAELNIAENNFVHVGTYKIAIKLEESAKEQFFVDSSSEISYKIIAKDPKNALHSVVVGETTKYYADAILGIQIKDAVANILESVEKGKWQVVSVDDGNIIDASFAFDANNYSTTAYKYKFIPDAGYENDYIINEQDVYIKKNDKPKVVFKKLTSNATLTNDQISETEVEGVKKIRFTTLSNSETKPGYTFKGWLLEGGPEEAYAVNTEVTLALQARYIFTQKWEAKTDTVFKLEFLFQRLSDESQYNKGPGPGSSDTSTSTGTTGEGLTDEKINEIAQDILGFSFNLEKTKNDENNKNFVISGDGNSTFKFYYDRKTYTVIYSKGEDATVTGEVPVDEKPSGYKYGESINLADGELLKKPGYSIKGWTDGINKDANGKLKVYLITDIFKIENNVKMDTAELTFTVSFNPRDDVPYIFYQLTSDGTNIVEPTIKRGTSDSNVVVIPSLKGYNKISSPNEEHKSSGLVAPIDTTASTVEELAAVEGILKLYIYYEKASYTLRYLESSLADEQYNYGDTFVVKKLENEATRKFLHWKFDSNSIYKAGETKTIIGNLDLIPVWENLSSSDIVSGDSGNSNTFNITKAKTELSGGEIAGISISVIIVVGVSVFCIVWFGVLKKTFKDLRPSKKNKNKKGFLK